MEEEYPPEATPVDEPTALEADPSLEESAEPTLEETAEPALEEIVEPVDPIMQFAPIEGPPVESLLRFMNEIFLPVVRDAENWPQSVKKEFTGYVHKFMAVLTETAYQIRGSTVLYIPPEDLDAVDKDQDLLQRLESACIYWTRQIKEVVSSQDTAEHGESAGPLTEIAFWKARCEDLSGISGQLRSPELLKILQVLQEKHSTYLKQFESLAALIKQGYDEAENNLKFLSQLQDPCNELAKAEPKDIPRVLPKILNLIRLIWANSRYYFSKERITGLLRKISNEIINRCVASISLDDLFNGQVEKSNMVLEASIQAGDAWKKLFVDVTVRLQQRATALRKWEVDENSIFAQIHAFVQRCRDLKEVCEGQIQFARKSDGQTVGLPRFGGTRGPEVAKNLLDIQAAFERQIALLRDLPYFILDVKATRWHDDFNSFKKAVKELEAKMRNVIDSAFDMVNIGEAGKACYSVAHGVELLEAFYSLARREQIRRHVDTMSAEVWKSFQDELNKVKKLYADKDTNAVIASGHPPIPGRAVFNHTLLLRIKQQFELLDSAHWINVPKEADSRSDIRVEYFELVQALEKSIQNLYIEWVTPVNETNYSKALEIPILARPDDHDRFLEVNFDKGLLRLFAEIQLWQRLKQDIPYSALELYHQADEKRITRENVLLLVHEYNDILAALNDDERKLFRDRIYHLDKRVNPGLSKLFWTSRGVVEFTQDCRKMCREVSELVMAFKASHKSILRNCFEIANSVLVQIDKKFIYTSEKFEKQQADHREAKRAHLQKLHEEIINTMRATYETFRGDSDDVQSQWRVYMRKIDKQIEDALRQSIRRSLQEISRSITGDTKTPEVPPMFSVNVCLLQNRVEFRPSLNQLIDLMKDCCNKMMQIISVVPRLTEILSSTLATRAETPEEDEEEEGAQSSNSNASFWEVISREEDILRVYSGIAQGMSGMQSKLSEVAERWSLHKHIWEVDQDAFIRRYARGNRPLSNFDSDISKYRELQNEIGTEESTMNKDFLQLDFSMLKASIMALCSQWQQKFTGLLNSIALTELKALHALFSTSTQKLSKPPTSLDQLGEALKLIKNLQETLAQTEGRFEPLQAQYNTLQKYEVNIPESERALLDSIPAAWGDFKTMLAEAQVMLDLAKDRFKKDLLQNTEEFNKSAAELKQLFNDTAPFEAEMGSAKGISYCDEWNEKLAGFKNREEELKRGLSMFGIEKEPQKDVVSISKDLANLRQIWELTRDWNNSWNSWKSTQFKVVDCEQMDNVAKEFFKKLQVLGRQIKHWTVWVVLKDKVDQFRRTMPLIENLKSPSMRDRHWQLLMQEIGKTFDYQGIDFTLENIFELGLDSSAEFIEQLAASAKQELAIEDSLKKIAAAWESLDLDIVVYRQSHRIRSTEDVNQVLEDNVVTLGAMKTSRYYHAFAGQIDKWERTLSHISETIEMMLQVQRSWMYLESIFGGSEDIRRMLPQESTRFFDVNSKWKNIIARCVDTKNVLKCMHQPGLLEMLKEMNRTLDEIQKALEEYLEAKRKEFPRFYFLSNADLLEILGQSRDPQAVQPHLKKCFEAIKSIKMEVSKDGKKPTEATGMYSPENEFVEWNSRVITEGPVERWLSGVEAEMRATLRKRLDKVFSTLKTARLSKWVEDHVGQLTILARQIQWTNDVTKALLDVEKGSKTAMKHLFSKQKALLKELSKMVRSSKISFLTRLKVNALITIEVHSRDVIEKLWHNHCQSASDFEWQSQLRFGRDKDSDVCVVKQTNTQLTYYYEYLGNSGRLVITPLTDRCYMTLTTALHLRRGGNPQGPAGTGKTETVKDLGKAIGEFVLVFNCSDGLDYKSLGKMFSGLAQTGAWSCFDEFNRIEVEVLSVVAQQIQQILAAISRGDKRFIFDDAEIPLVSSCGIFVTMNPGYAGRSELPDNLKALFRPVSMMVPDSTLISEIMLFAEGFDEAKPLSKKITTLYRLSIQQLSKQDHYDFGLRAIKSVLNQAGTLKRADTQQESQTNEEVLLLRALMDMNLPKFVAEDVPLFLGIIRDLFPSISMPTIDYGKLQIAIEQEMREQGLQVHQPLVQKVIQLYESKNTRHGNMVVGRTGSGKSACWKTLQRALTRLNNDKVPGFQKVQVYVINPKAIDGDELYGYYEGATREWSEGVLSKVMRTCVTDDKPDEKWIMLDGPVDTLWIESMNSVLDDNKVLTLINGERISLISTTSLLFEVEDLAVASPATVSRCGMVYMDVSELGWEPYVKSWRERRKDDAEQVETLDRLFEKFVAKTLEFKSRECRELVPITDLNAVESLCSLYDVLATPENGVDPKESDSYVPMIEKVFIFSLVWSIGAAVDEEGRRKIDLFLRDIDGSFPSGGRDTIYDYYVNKKSHVWAKWEDKISAGWRPQPADLPFYRILVPTVDTVRNTFLVSTLVQAKRHVLLVGGTGTGKTVLAQHALAQLEPTQWSTLVVNFSSATSSPRVQDILESNMERRTKESLAPPGGRAMVVFIDDLNMPKKDDFGSQPPLELLRQWRDYGFWYERSATSRRKISVRGMQMLAAMGPPGGGRSVITPRFQRAFHLINFTFPDDSQIKRIFGTLLALHFNDWDDEIKALIEPLTQGTLDVFKVVLADKLPTPLKSHYVFNMRDMSKVIQGMLLSDKRYYDGREAVLRLWIHESFRVYHDRMISEEDRTWFRECMSTRLVALFNLSWKQVCGTGPAPLFCNMLRDADPPVYEEVTDIKKLQKFLLSKLEEYNWEPGMVGMNLVLFRDAIEHVIRIHRVLRTPRGNALLIGVGGSGRSSLARLAAFIAGYKVVTIEITKQYGSVQFHEDLKKMFRMAGVEQKPTVFLFSDTQIAHESFLEDINNMLSSGEVPNLYAKDELQVLFESLRPEARVAGVEDNSQSLFNFFLERARANLHIVLCMSPVGEAFRARVRQYPSLVNCTSMNWFSEWPQDALGEVARAKMDETEIVPADHKESIALIFVTFQQVAADNTRKMVLEMKRRNYITPTHYLELVTGYLSLMTEKKKQLSDAAEKLRGGLDKLEETKRTVESMSIQLEEDKLEVARAQKSAEELLVNIVSQRKTAEEQQKAVQAESERISAEEIKIRIETEAAQQDLAEAVPALEDAKRALDALTKKDVAEVKAFTSPPPLVELVMSAVMVLFKAETTWAEAKRRLGDAGFLNSLVMYDKDHISEGMLKKLEKFMNNKEFAPDIVGRQSVAAKGLCMWCRAMYIYAQVFRKVAPKKEAVRIMEERLKKAESELAQAKASLKEVQDRLAELERGHQQSIRTRDELRKRAEETERKLDRAEKLVSNLGGERERWKNSIQMYEVSIKNLVGDCLVAAAFLTYAGPFPSTYRTDMVTKWLARVKELNVPHTPAFSFENFLSVPTQTREWNLQGLPTDGFSIQNGVLVTRGRRWPLMVDPQEQAKKWIRNMEGKNGLKEITLKMPDFLRTMENAIKFGNPILLNDVQEELDPALEPVLAKNIQKKGGTSIIRLGDKEVEFNEAFKLYITTKLSNPHYPPEISTKTTIVNFAVKQQGLEQQLLGIVVGKEKPELERQKDDLVISMAANNKKIQELEDEILRLLATTTGSLLDNEELLITLQTSKVTAEDIQVQLQDAIITEQKIDKTRELYKPVSLRAAILFFVLINLGNVDPMYQFSLDAYNSLFEMSISMAPKADDLNERIRNLINTHTQNVYRMTCRGLFERHKLLFSFEMCIKINQAASKINEEEYSFFLRGGSVIDRSDQAENVNRDWISELAWDHITELDKLSNFNNIVQSFQQNGAAWLEWYRSSDPAVAAMPDNWDHKLNELQRMIILRCLRPDRVMLAAKSFIINNLGREYVEPPAFILNDIYADSTATVPLIFVLSPGVDPTSNLQQLAVLKGMSSKFKSLALGQGQGPIADKLIQDGIREGHWVFLANCHLMLSWMTQLEKHVEVLPGKQPHKDFRLWLSSYPHEKFPISVLQRSVKMTTEPPRGLRQNLIRLYSIIPEATFNQGEGQQWHSKYKKLLFGLCFFHSVLLERRKFQTLGWNIPYEFNDSDFEVCESILRIYLQDYPDTPWEALRYLIAEANYGGRVTDDWDRRLLLSYMNGYFVEGALTDVMFRLSSLAQYYIPEDGPLQSYKDYIMSLDSVDRPEAFGQHANADIASQIMETTSLLETLVSLQPQQVASAGKGREEIVYELCENMLETTPQPIDVLRVQEIKTGDSTPLTTVLFQEIHRYNELLRMIHSSLAELQKGIKGLVVISQDQETIFQSLYDGKVPQLWQKAYPSLKPLGSWSRDLILRVAQLQQWGEGSQPKVFWLSGFTFPTGFLTAVLQTTARKTNTPIDQLAWDFTVTQYVDLREVTAPPKEGVYIRGLFLEGARWDRERGQLTEPLPMELSDQMPIVLFKPIDAKRKVLKGTYSCPCYMYPVRTGTRERPSFMLPVELKTADSPDHWVKRGAALLLALAQ